MLVWFKCIESNATLTAFCNCTTCHGPAGVPRLATRCLCLLSTWLVVCLVPCAPMSIVCPLPSCYLIIVSVAPAVSPSLPSFVSLYSSPCVCSPVLIRCLSCVVRYVSVSCLTVPQSSACLLVFPLRGGFCSLFCFIIKNNNSLCIWVLDLIPCDRTDQPHEDSAEGATGNHGSRA